MKKDTIEALKALVNAQQKFNATITEEVFMGTPEAARKVIAASDNALSALAHETPDEPAKPAAPAQGQ